MRCTTFLPALVAFAASCAAAETRDAFDGGGDAALDAEARFDAWTLGDSGAPPDASTCSPPDLLVVLDRTDSMKKEPSGATPTNNPTGHALTKWALACDAVKAASAPPADEGIRFGLELFPLDPQVVTDAGGAGHCETLTALLGGAASTNTECMPGEPVVAPDVGTGAQIATILDPETLDLCISTPIAGALTTAQGTLAQMTDPGRKIVVLVTDGGETCVTSAEDITITQGLASAGISTYVVGFGAADAGAAGVNVALLNDLACAGMTASSFATSCTKSGSGYVAVAPNGPPLFFLAEDGTALQGALASVTKDVCCDCVH